MKNYDCYSSEWFETTKPEVDKLFTHTQMNITFYDHNLAAVRAQCFEDITDFTLKFIPKHLKRSNFDSALLLVVIRGDGAYMAKRHNSNQKLKFKT